LKIQEIDCILRGLEVLKVILKGLTSIGGMYLEGTESLEGHLEGTDFNPRLRRLGPVPDVFETRLKVPTKTAKRCNGLKVLTKV
jgi:hypothetical protein